MRPKAELTPRPILDNSQVGPTQTSTGRTRNQLIDEMYGRAPDIDNLLNRAPVRTLQPFKGKLPPIPLE